MINTLQSVLTMATTSTMILSATSPLLGRAFPPPTNVASDAKFRVAIKSFDALLSTHLSDSGANQNTSFSVSVFSASDPALLYERHHTSETVAKASFGINEINGDSIYRIGSISKLLTVYTFLIQAGDRHLNEPITDYVPELLEMGGHVHLGPNWEEITLGELASHLSGISRDYGLNDFSVHDYEMVAGYPRLQPPLLPPLIPSDKPICGYLDSSGAYATCDQTDLIWGVANAPAAFPPSYTPAYCNNGFVLFALALERMKQEPFERLFNRSILEPLALHRSSYSVPSATQWLYGVVPGDPSQCGWSNEFGAFSPAGANYMSLKDISALGKSILRSDFISKAQTRRWLKPKSHLADISKAVGMPWEIERVQVGERVVDMYTKDGDWNVYSSKIALIPEYDLGFSILTASDAIPLKRQAGLQVISGVDNGIVKVLLPALENIAKERATQRFAGLYTSTDDVPHAIVLEADSHPLIRLTKWVYNGTDILRELGRPFSETGQAVDFRLQPNGLDNDSEIGFTALCSSDAWGTVNLFRYGNIGLDQFVFDVDTNGMADYLQLRALRAVLKRAPLP